MNIYHSGLGLKNIAGSAAAQDGGQNMANMAVNQKSNIKADENDSDKGIRLFGTEQ